MQFDASPSTELRRQIRQARLCYVDDHRPGLQREASRGIVVYRDASGRVIRNSEVLARIRALAIPPAWVEVWICPSANGHIQATGRDARKRKQYRYHPQWRAVREEAKYASLFEFGRALPGLRRRVERDLKRPGLSRERVLAAVVRLLDSTHLRVGNTEYLRANKSQGLSTLFDQNVTFHGATIQLRFRGKSGVWHDRKVTDARLAQVVKMCRDVPGKELFQYLDDEGVPRTISAGDVNDYLQRRTGLFTAKTFRTWAGSVKALSHLIAEPPPPSKTAGQRVLVRVIKAVAADMGNTPAVCRKSYVHPLVFDAYLSGKLERVTNASTGRNLSVNECRFLALLQMKQKARLTG
jgi:DNA topoisomerase-1